MNEKAIDRVVKAVLKKYKDSELNLYLLEQTIKSLSMGEDVSEELIEKMILEELNKELLKKD